MTTRPSFIERAKAKSEKSKHYATSRQHAINTVGYFGMFMASVVIEHMVEEWQNRKASSSDEEGEPAQAKRSSGGVVDRILRGF